ncbi:beta-lactamase family protein [Telmatocola sphagniphila]|uniref:Beta-lactamase family protein n=1 Tax=Telmatocola sphagniphila TaxID=1123043 RepID=A0A8E6B8A5_9BACT|nr:serine hydrolase domain-containing protein [Telmatocola sphagniphila]QVL33733.1 beta-lactamase family protein [Telmatocola sphagniphila]
MNCASYSLLLSVVFCLGPACTSRCFAAEPIDLAAGIWDSDWGYFTFRTTPHKDSKLLSVTGTYLHAKDQTGLLKSGTFDPTTRVLEFAFEEPWRGDKVKGTARLTLGPLGRRFKGTFNLLNENGGQDKGDLTLLHLLGRDFATRVESIIADTGKEPHKPGGAILVLEQGKIAFRKCYGLAHLKENRAITPQTPFELASCSKQFTGTAILLLYEQGKLALDEDIRKYLPELPEYDKKNPIRILHLARQTSGLHEYMDFENVKGKHPKYVTNEDYVSLFARERTKSPLYFPTGSNWRYTNTNFMLLALIVERVSKQSFNAFLKKEIFDKLAMKTAGVYDRPNFQIHEPALGYEKEKDKNKWNEIWGPPPYRHESNLVVGDGSVWASLEDLARWDEGWREGKVLKPATIKQALVPSKYGKDGTTDYAFGWGITMDKGKISQMGHNGGWGGFRTIIERNVAEDRTLIVLDNGDNLDIEAIVRLFRVMPPRSPK